MLYNGSGINVGHWRMNRALPGTEGRTFYPEGYCRAPRHRSGKFMVASSETSTESHGARQYSSWMNIYWGLRGVRKVGKT